MRAQSQFMSMVESWTNVAAGLGIQVVANIILIPVLFGVAAATGKVLWFAAIMTVLSVARSFVLRRIFEFVRTRNTPPDFVPIIEEIAAERLRQINGEGFNLAHDDQHEDGELAAAAATYAYAASLPKLVRRGLLHPEWNCQPSQAKHAFNIWPATWALSWFKPTHARRDLIKAAAMIVAEIGRIDRTVRRGHS